MSEHTTRKQIRIMSQEKKTKASALRTRIKVHCATLQPAALARKDALEHSMNGELEYQIRCG